MAGKRWLAQKEQNNNTIMLKMPKKGTIVLTVRVLFMIK